MIDEHDIHTNEALTPEQDAELRSKIKRSFDEVKLSDESRESMLAALKQVQSESTTEPARKARKPAARILRFVLPAAAACLAFVVVVASLNVPSMMSGSSPTLKQETQSSGAALQEKDAQNTPSAADMAKESANEYGNAALSATPSVWFSTVELSDGTRLNVTHDAVDTPHEGQIEEALAMNEDASKNASCRVIRIDGEHCIVSFDNETWYLATIDS